MGVTGENYLYEILIWVYCHFAKTKCLCIMMATAKLLRHLRRCLFVGQENGKVKGVEDPHVFHILCRSGISYRDVFLHRQFCTIQEVWKNAGRFVNQ